MSTDPRSIAAATLASLPLITTPRLRRMFETFGDPVPALAAVRAGHGRQFIGRCTEREPSALASEWREFAESPNLALRFQERRTHVWVAGDHDYPIPDPLPDRPPVLLGEGERPDALERSRVAIVGTRTAERCFSTRLPNSPRVCSKRCGNHSRNVRSASAARPARSSSRPTSC